MEESLILSKFDNLVQSGLVLYDDKQQIIEHIDGDLKVFITSPTTIQIKHLLTRLQSSNLFSLLLSPKNPP